MVKMTPKYHKNKKSENKKSYKGKVINIYEKTSKTFSGLKRAKKAQNKLGLSWAKLSYSWG